MPQQTQSIAVLTGDLFRSTELGPENIIHAFKVLEEHSKAFARWHEAPMHFSRHRGDGWQVVLARPDLALRTALAFRAALRAGGNEFDSYIGIATGEVSGEIGPDLNRETARPFVESGRLVDHLKDVPSWIRMMHKSGGAISSTTGLVDYISQGWTPTQAMTILPLLDPLQKPSLTDLAKALGKSRQAVSKAAEAAAFAPLVFALKTIEDAAHD